jgi:hypothetical protein
MITDPSGTWRAVVAYHGGRPIDCTVRGAGFVHALPLNGLDNERCHIVLCQFLAQCGDVGKGHRLAARQQATEAVSEFSPSVKGERPGGQAVKGMLGEEDPRPLGGLAGELEGRLNGLGP